MAEDKSRVTFSSEGIGIAGDLRVPPGVGQRPAIALTGPFTGVKEQVTGTYARLLADAGFVTLAFDHRGFGESGGRPQHEDAQGKLADLRAAVTLLASRDDVDPGRIAIVGICLGGGYAVRAAASDARVKAVAGVAGGYNSPAAMVQGMGTEAYRAALSGFLARYDEYLPAVAADGGEAAMGGDEPYEYYGTQRSAARHWRNQVTWGSLHSLMTFDAMGAADLLGGTPLLVVHGKQDAYCSPELARELRERAPGHNEAVWLDARQHIDLYDREPYVTQAVAAVAAFLHRALLGCPRRDLEQFFYLDDADLKLVAGLRGDHNRLGLSVQLATARFDGRFLADLLEGGADRGHQLPGRPAADSRPVVREEVRAAGADPPRACREDPGGSGAEGLHAGGGGAFGVCGQAGVGDRGRPEGHLPRRGGVAAGAGCAAAGGVAAGPPSAAPQKFLIDPDQPGCYSW